MNALSSARHLARLVNMAKRNDNATQPTDVEPAAFVDAVEHPTRRADAQVLLDLMQEISGEEPRMWGDSIVGFGTYHYRYASGREGDWMRIGFSPRKSSLALYGLQSAPHAQALLAKLGKHKTGVGCVYVNKLADVDDEVLRALVASAWENSVDGPC